MANNPVVNTLTFAGSVAGQATIQAQGIAGGLTFLLPNTVPVQGQLMTALSINGNNVFLGWASSQSLSNIPLSALAQSGATPGQVIEWNGSAWVASTGVPGSGTVTSVAFSVPAELSIAGSPITTAGTLALSWASGTGSGGQGKVIATPAGGGAGAYAGRVLVAGDIPALAYLPSGTQLPVTFAPVSNQFLTSYTSGTGLFTAAQASFAGLSGSLAVSQINSKRGNGGFVQIAASGTAGAAGDVVTFDANGNTIDSGILIASLAPLASPSFSGSGSIPTWSVSTNLNLQGCPISAHHSGGTGNTTGGAGAILISTGTEVQWDQGLSVPSMTIDPTNLNVKIDMNSSGGTGVALQVLADSGVSNIAQFDKANSGAGVWIDTNGNLWPRQAVLDAGGVAGTSGQVLTSTVTGTSWSSSAALTALTAAIHISEPGNSRGIYVGAAPAGAGHIWLWSPSGSSLVDVSDTGTAISGASSFTSANPTFFSAQGNGSKVQLSTGTTTTDNVVKYDASGNTVDSGVSSADIPRKSVVSLSSAQLLALGTTPVQVIPAPGAGKYINPLFGAASYHFVTTPYTGAGTGTHFFVINPANVPNDINQLGFESGFLDSLGTSTSSVIQIGQNFGFSATAANLDNQAFTVSFDTASNILTLGDGTVTITVYYTIEASAA